MDSIESYQIQKEDHHSKGLHLPKHHLKHGYVNKKLLSFTAISEVPEIDDGNLVPNNDLSYSLNKNGRWNLVNEFRHGIENYNDDEDLRVSVVEKEVTGLGSRSRARDTVAYHAVDEDGDATHKYTAKGYAFEKTLTEKPKQCKKKGKGRRRGNVMVEEDETPDMVRDPNQHHVRYEVVNQTQSVGLYEKEKKKRHHRDTCGQLSRSLRRAALNCYEDWGICTDNHDEDWFELCEDDDDENAQLELSTIPEECNEMSTDMETNLLQYTLQPVNKAEKRIRKKRNANSITDPADRKPVRHLMYEIDNDTDIVEITTENVVPPIVQPNLIGIANFTMESVEFVCPTVDLDVEALVEMYSAAYYECACIPRRFCIDVSGSVRNVLHSMYPTASTLDIQTICIFEMAPPQLMAASASAVETSKLRVWLNGGFTNDMQSFGLKTMNPCEIHSIHQLVQAAIKTFTTLPYENFVQKEINAPVSLNRLLDVHARILDDTASNCMHTNELTEIVLQKEELARKLQRQLTAVRTYDWFSDVGENTCGICLDWLIESSGFCLASCQHWFCKSCWRTYCSDRIRNGLIPVKCPDSSCDVIMDYDLLTTILPLPQCILFANQYRDRYVTANSKNWIWCPNIKCGRIIFSENHNLRTSSVCSCLCGEMWCAHCKGPVHWPAGCEQAKNYYAKLKREGHLNRVVHGSIKFVSVKKCPHCHLMMEKNTGCRFMACRCGNAFCWDCGHKWNDYVHDNCAKHLSEFKQVKLVDHLKNADGQVWSSDLYERCVFHHEAILSNKFKDLKRMIMSCISSHKNAMELIKQNTSETAEPKLTDDKGLVPELLNKTESVQKFLDSFFELQYQYHYILEYTYLWLQSVPQNNRSVTRRILSLADRLTFMVSRLEDACAAGNLGKIIELMQSSKQLLLNLVNEIVLQKRQV